MSDEMKVESKNKLNKTLLLIVALILGIVLIALLVIFVPKAAKAKSVENQLSLGEKYIDELDYEQAIASYLAVIEIDPKNEDAYLALADIYMEMGEYEKAEEILEQAEDEILSKDIWEKQQDVENAIEEVENTLTQAVVPTAVPTATVAPQETLTPVPTATNTPVPTATNTPVPTATSTPVPAATNTPVPTATSTPKPTATSTPVPTATSTPVPSATSTPVPTATSTPKPTATSTPTPIPTATNTPVPTATSTPVPTPTSTPIPTPSWVFVEVVLQDENGNALEAAEVILTDETGVLYKAVAVENEFGERIYCIEVKAGYYDLNISSHGYRSIQESIYVDSDILYLERDMESEYMSPDYGEIAGHRYQFFSAKSLEWEEIESLCYMMGGYLATISSEIENEFLYKMMRENGYYNAYFGYSDAEEEGTWKWLSGESTYENWANGEPNDDCGGEDYAMFYYMFEDGTWNDGNFGHGTLNDDKVFICEWDSLE